MRADERGQWEDEIHDLCRQGQMGLAVERALQGYGQEVFRLMVSVLHDPERAQDAFSLFSEALLKGLPGFRWESSFRTWAYRMARNVCYQMMHERTSREMPVAASAIPERSVGQRSATRPWQQTSVKERFRTLRERLEPQERMLLMLRVDQRLSWQEVAQVMSDPNEQVTREALARKAAALRQQFQRIKSHLRTLAIQEGLIPSEEAPTQEEHLEEQGYSPQ